jgi:hypothetical protein
VIPLYYLFKNGRLDVLIFHMYLDGLNMNDFAFAPSQLPDKTTGLVRMRIRFGRSLVSLFV